MAQDLIAAHMHLKGCFKVKIGSEVLKCGVLGKVPDSFDNLICFLPDPIPEPHTEADHQVMRKYVDIQKELLKRGRKD